MTNRGDSAEPGLEFLEILLTCLPSSRPYRAYRKDYWAL